MVQQPRLLEEESGAQVFGGSDGHYLGFVDVPLVKLSQDLPTGVIGEDGTQRFELVRLDGWFGTVEGDVERDHFSISSRQ
jgi:hypothetical protein